MAGSAPILRNGELSLGTPDYYLTLQYVLTAGSGVNTATLVEPQKIISSAVGGGTGSAIASLSQTLCDQAMGEVDGVVATTIFGTTAMVDNDTYGGVFGLSGQVAKLGVCEAKVNIAGTITQYQVQATTTALPNSAFTGLEVYISAEGNIAWRITATNISAAATAGFLVLTFPVFLK